MKYSLYYEKVVFYILNDLCGISIYHLTFPGIPHREGLPFFITPFSIFRKAFFVGVSSLAHTEMCASSHSHFPYSSISRNWRKLFCTNLLSFVGFDFDLDEVWAPLNPHLRSLKSTSSTPRYVLHTLTYQTKVPV